MGQLRFIIRIYIPNKPSTQNIRETLLGIHPDKNFENHTFKVIVDEWDSNFDIALSKIVRLLDNGNSKIYTHLILPYIVSVSCTEIKLKEDKDNSVCL